LDDFSQEHGLWAVPLKFVPCPNCGSPVAMLSFVDSADLDSPQQIEAVRDMAMVAEILPAYVAVRLPGTDDVARVREVWPEVGEYTLTRDQWAHVVAGLQEQHTCVE
jgi:hypothetical protein